MGPSRTVGLIWLAVFVCLPGLLHARGASVPPRVMPAPVALVTFDLQVADAGSQVSARKRFGSWEITVSFDRATCAVSCVYRRVGGSRKTDLLLPPVATIRVFPGSASLPVVVNVDPGGLDSPSVRSACRMQHSHLCAHDRTFPAFARYAHNHFEHARAGSLQVPTPFSRPHLATPLRI